jgi:O-antigen ligase
MRAGLRVIPRHPWLGVGLDAHKRHWHEWGFPGDYVTHTHSTPIQIALDRGLLALGCYVWLLATMIGFAWRGYKLQQTDGRPFAAGLSLGVFGALSGFTASSLANYNFGDSETLLLLLLLVGLLIVEDSEPLTQAGLA